MVCFHGVRSGALAPPSMSSRSTAISSSITRRQSPAIGTSGRRTFPSSAGSTSTWMIFASGAKVGTLPVTRSSNRLPRAMSRSDRCIDVTAE